MGIPLLQTNQPALYRPERCPGCPYHSRTCGPKGPVDSPFVIVGESPGTSEIAKGQPFVGISGQLLDSLLQQVGLDVEPYVTNSVACLPVGKTSANLATACGSCSKRLYDEIKAHPRKVILALGNGALWGLTGNFNYRITAERGKVIPSELAEQGIVPAIHPAALFHGTGSQRLLKEDIQLAVSLLKGKETRKCIDADCFLMETEGDIRDLIDMASQQEYIAADIETSDLKYRRGYILSQGFCWVPKESYIVPPYLFKFLGEIYNPISVPAKWIWHNGKFDVGWLRHEALRHWDASDWYVRVEQHVVAKYGPRRFYECSRVDEDTMLLSYCIDENGGIHDLEQVASDLIGAPNWKSVIDQYRPSKTASYAYIPPTVLYKYQAKDLSYTRQVFPILRKKVASDPKLEKLYTRMLIPASDMLTFVESCGFKANQDKIDQNRIVYQGTPVPGAKEQYTGGKINEYKEAVNVWSRKVLGYDINPGSWQQVQKLIYLGGLDLAKGKILDTNEKTFQKLPDHPVLQAIMDYRGAKKLLGTYIEGIEDRIDNDGRVRCSFLLHATTTGRLASRDPNLQNIVRDDEIRAEFEAAPGYVLVERDLSQAELRSLACLSGDKRLCEIYETPHTSIHKIVAAKFYGKEYSHDQYQLAKAITFGIVYGREAFSIAQEYKMSVKDAQAYIDAWFDQFPEAREFINKCRDAPLRGKILQTPFGRKRRFGVVSPEKAHDVGNQAANFPHQSIASDITLQAAIEVRPKLVRWGIRVPDLIHDAILMEIPDREDLIMDASLYVKSVMEATPPKWGITRVPFLADEKRGPIWGYMKEPGK